MPQSMWLSYLKVDALPSQLTYDLAVDATGADKPSAVAAGFDDVAQPAPVADAVDADGSGSPVLPWAVGGAVALVAVAGGVLVAARRR